MQPTFIFVLICQGNELCDDKLRYFHEATNQSAENGPGEKTAILRVACASLQKLPAPFSTQNDLWLWIFYYKKTLLPAIKNENFWSKAFKY